MRMRQVVHDAPENRINRLIEGIRMQMEDFDGAQLDKLIDMLLFERADREKDLEELKGVDDGT